MRTLYRVCLPALLCVVFTTGCKKKLTCGEGTTEEGKKCVAEGGDGDNLGGAGGDGDGDGDGDGFEGIPASRWDDAETILAEFEGAKAAGPASPTDAFVGWDLPSVPDVTYNIYVSTEDDNFTFGSPQFTAPAGAETALLTDLEKNATVFIVVRAVLMGVELVGEDTILEVELSADSAPPTFLGATDAETEDGAGVTLSWDAASDALSPDGILTYLVYLGTDAEDVPLLSPYAVSSPGATSITVTTPAPDTEYFFIVRARDAAGNTDDNEIVVSAVSGPDVVAPAFSGCSSATVRNASSFNVEWKPAVDDIADASEISYNLYASTEPNGHNFSQPNDTIVGGSGGILTGLEADTTYYVVCRAVDPSGNEEENTRTQFATTKDDDVPPEFGGITAVENLSSETVDLSWNAATDNQTVQEDIIYRVYLSETEDGHDFEMDAPWIETPAGAVSVTLQDLTSRTDYFIVVLAVDDANNQSEPLPATAITTLVSLRADIEFPIFSQKCATTGCHSGDTPQAGLVLAPGVSFTNLVGVPATTGLGVSSGFDRVEPFDPEASHLVQRLKYEDLIQRMPQGGDGTLPLSAGEIATIELWITQGALSN